MFVLFYLLCVLVIYLSTVDKYDVIYDLEPAIPQGSLNNKNGNGFFLGGGVLFFIFISQAAFFYFEKSRKWKLATGIMTVLAFLFFFAR